MLPTIILSFPMSRRRVQLVLGASANIVTTVRSIFNLPRRDFECRFLDFLLVLSLIVTVTITNLHMADVYRYVWV
jgi:hypothetical protein